MLKRFAALALCSSLLLGAAASATSAQDIIKQSNAQIAASTTIRHDSNQSVVVRGNGNNQSAARNNRASRAPRGTSTGSSVSSSCTNGSCTVTVNGVAYGPFEGRSVSVSQNSVNGVSTTEISVDGQVVLKL